MKIRLVLQLLIAVAVPLSLTACTDADSGQRPRLFANDAARIGDVGPVETLETAPDQFGEMINVRLMSCAPGVAGPALLRSRQPGSRPSGARTTPRLVIGEPACVSATVFEGVLRID